MRRRLVTLGLVVLVLAGLWSGAWFALAAWTEGRISTALAEIARRGVEVDCSERDMVGFPFSMKLACGETAVSERSSGTAAEFASLTGGASVFAPMTASIDLASPAQLESPLLAGPATLRWDDTDIDVGMGMSGPQSVSFDASNFSAELTLPELAGAKVAAVSADGTLSPTADGGTDASLAFRGLALSANGASVPPFDGTVSAQLSLPPRALLAGRAALQAPLSASDMRISLTSGAARLDAEGDISVDAEGIVDGAIIVRIAGAEALADFIAALPPERRQLGNAAVGGMLAFGKATTVDGKPGSELLIKIERGLARIGPVEFRLPRVPL